MKKKTNQQNPVNLVLILKAKLIFKMKYWVHILEKMRAEFVLNIALFEVQTNWMFVLHSLIPLPSCSMSLELSYFSLWKNIVLLFILWWSCPWAKSSIFEASLSLSLPCNLFICSNSIAYFHDYKKTVSGKWKNLKPNHNFKTLSHKLNMWNKDGIY